MPKPLSPSIRARATFAVLAVVAAWLAWLAWPAAHGPAPPPPPASATPTGPCDADDGTANVAAATPVDPAAGRPAAVAARELVAAFPVVPADPELGSTGAWELEVQVFDDADVPVADAVVEAFAGERAAPRDGAAPDVWLGRAPGPPLVAARTDADGRCLLRVERPFVVVAAHHDACGRSVSRGVAATPKPAPVRLWLTRAVLVRGTVFDADLRPAAFATVRVEARDFVEVVAGADGRFRFEAEAGANCRLEARAQGAHSQPLQVVAADGLELMIAMHRGFGIAGRVVFPDGTGAPFATVTAVAGAGAVRAGGSGVCDVDGCFRLFVAAAGRYCVFALSPRGDASVLLDVDVTAASPRPTVLLQLRPATLLRGRVREADGAPASGAAAQATAAGASWRSGTRTETAADGSFVLAVRGAGPWSVTARHDGRIAGREVSAAAAADVELVLPLQGDEVVRAAIVRDDDGAPVDAFDAYWTPSRAGGGRTNLDVVTREGRTFALGEVPGGGDWWILVEPRDPALAPELIGPFRAGEPHGAVAVRLRRWADLPVRVVDARGGPLRAILLEVELGNLTLCGRTDAAGRAVVRVPPASLRVTASRGAEAVGAVDVHAVPGANPEVVLRLAR